MRIKDDRRTLKIVPEFHEVDYVEIKVGRTTFTIEEDSNGIRLTKQTNGCLNIECASGNLVTLS